MSNKKNLLNSIMVQAPPRNAFDLSHDVKLSTQMGRLTPIMCTEVVPGDKIGIACESLIRFAPLVAPVMHRFDVTMHYFFVPNRILWANWENFITQTKVGGNVPAFPYVSMNAANWNQLADYMGVPEPLGNPDQDETVQISVLAFAAYQKVWNDFYRDQNLQTDICPPQTYMLNDGNNTADWLTKLGVLRNRCWEHDYFTAALPFAQKGDPVNIPLGFPDLPVLHNAANPTTLTGAPDNVYLPSDPTTDTTEDAYVKTSTLDQNTTINDLRRAIKLQEWLEKNARGGTRYSEHIKVHFDVTSSDKRLQRPEYITGIKTPVQISEVLQTGETATTPQGNMAGHGVAVASGKYGAYYAEEHGYVIGIMSIMPKTAYQQGIPRHFLKTKDAYQYYYPSFANIGEQEILNDEVYGYTEQGANIFGYIPRYAEYKFENNRVAGQFRTTQDFWHAGRIFANLPVLNDEFVESNPTQRIFAVTDTDIDQIYCHVLNKVMAIRPMPKYGTPSM